MDFLDHAVEIFKLGSKTSERRYGKPIVVTYSGGKDSDALIEVAKASGVNFEVHHSHTTCDAPQTVYHIREKFKELEKEGIKCNIEHPVYKGGASVYVEFNTTKAIPTYKNSKVLLQYSKRDWLQR